MASTDTVNMVNNSSASVLYQASLKSSSSEDPSLDILLYESLLEDSPKMKLYKKGLYDPGSKEICAKYITLSRSSVLNHQYYAYPSIKDPGIMNALLRPESDKIYDDEGQELYLDLCKEMQVIPVRAFHRGLKEEVINLKYYGVNPVGVRAMCLALAYNTTVQRLDLTGNFLEFGDACYHLGQLLGERTALQELVLAGCRIGHEGVNKLVVCLGQYKINLLDLSRNNIQDLGFTYLAKEIEMGAIIRKLNLSRNYLTSDSALLLAKAIAFNDNITHLDLSWNQFEKSRGPTALFRRLGHSKVLVELNFAWTSINLGPELRNLLRIPTLKVLDVSSNKLASVAAKTIAKSLHLAKRLRILDLSSNLFSPEDALMILRRMKYKIIGLEELRLDNIVVNREFALVLKEIMALDFRKKTKITHGYVLHNYIIPLADLKVITLKRFVLTSKKKHWNKLDVLEHLLEVKKKQNNLDPTELIETLKLYDAPVHEDIIEALAKQFPGPKKNNSRTINLIGLVDYIHRLWPEKQAPPTPPPTPPPEVVHVTKKKGKPKVLAKKMSVKKVTASKENVKKENTKKKGK